MKVCFRCRAAKEESEFNLSARANDGLQAYCRECQKQHYRDNAVRHRANVRRSSDLRTSRMREFVFAAMAGGCVDCGNTDIRVLEFDHVRGHKVDSIGSMVRRGLAIDVLLAEIAKCEIRCRNCHVIATFTRHGGSWHDDYLNGAPDRN